MSDPQAAALLALGTSKGNTVYVPHGAYMRDAILATGLHRGMCHAGMCVWSGQRVHQVDKRWFKCLYFSGLRPVMSV